MANRETPRENPRNNPRLHGIDLIVLLDVSLWRDDTRFRSVQRIDDNVGKALLYRFELGMLRSLLSARVAKLAYNEGRLFC